MTRSFHLSSRRMVVTLLIGVGLVASNALTVAAATGPYLVKDINPSGSSQPSWLTALGDKLLFSAKGGGKGQELWRSDGTSAGTVRVKDIRPGSGGSSPSELTAIGGSVYFNADNGTNGRELWITDGTAAGTRLIKDIRPGSGSSDPGGFAQLGALVYFRADDGVAGTELWRTDGTAAGTLRVKDMTPGAMGTSFFGVTTPLAGKLFFFVNDLDSGQRTMWRTNGTKAGTKPFRDSTGALIRGDIGPITVVGSRLFFGYNATLWRSNGTSASTVQIANVEVCCQEAFVGVGGTAFFESSGLWASDGTSASTRQLVAIDIDDLFAVGNRLFFFEPDIEPWTSDGTVAGTQPVGKEVETEGAGAAIGSVLYFSGYEQDESPGAATVGFPAFVPAPTTTVWRSDGTDAGTFSVGGSHANNGSFTVVDGSLFFTSNADGHGFELWRYVP